MTLQVAPAQPEALASYGGYGCYAEVERERFVIEWRERVGDDDDDVFYLFVKRSRRGPLQNQASGSRLGSLY